MNELPDIGKEGVLLKIFFKNIANKLTDAIVIISENFTIMTLNPSFQFIFGYTMQELLGKKIDEFIVLEKDKEESLEFKKKVIDGESIKIEKAIRKTKDDQIIAVEIIGIPISLSKGRKAIIIVYKNITQDIRYTKQQVISKRLDVFEKLSRGIIINIKSIMARVNKYINQGQIYINDPEGYKKQFNNAKLAVTEANLLANQFVAFLKNRDVILTNSIQDLKSMITFSGDWDSNKFIDSNTKAVNASKMEEVYGEMELLPLQPIRKGRMFELINNLIEELQNIHKGEDLTINISIINVDRRNPIEDLESGDYIRLSIELIGISSSSSMINRILKQYLKEPQELREIDLEYGSIYSVVKNHIGYVAIYNVKGKGTNLLFYVPVFY